MPGRIFGRHDRAALSCRFFYACGRRQIPRVNAPKELFMTTRPVPMKTAQDILATVDKLKIMSGDIRLIITGFQEKLDRIEQEINSLLNDWRQTTNHQD